MSDTDPRPESTPAVPPAQDAASAPNPAYAAPGAPAPVGASASPAATVPMSAPQPAPGSSFTQQSAPPTAPPAPPIGPGAAFPPPAASEPRPERARRFGPIAVGAALAVGALIGGTAGAGAAVVAISAFGSPSVQQNGSTSPQAITINDTDDVDIISAVAASATPSVVTISVRSESGSGTGSGVVIDDEGHIVTNTHVVTLDGAAADPTITVTTSDGRVLPATIVGLDPIMDLAVIAVDPAADLPAVEFADSADLNVGDQTIAIGAPLGLAGTVTSGIVSALNRSITVASSAVPEAQSSTTPEEQSQEGGDPFDFFSFDIPGQSGGSGATSTIQLAVIQTDTAINPGNSGGALLDDQARLIGINVAIATASSSSSGDIGIGFAIPSNVVQRVSAELIANGIASHGLLGASVANVTEDPAQVDAGVVGASIVELVPGGAAEAAGLKVGDIVIDFDGSPITGKNDLTAQVRTHAAGATATVTVVRGGESKTVEVTLGSL